MKIKHVAVPALSVRGVKLYKIAGWSIFGICILHLAYWCIETWRSWGAWISGELWAISSETREQAVLHFHFWALPGSFMVPLALLALLVVRAANRQEKLPAYLGWVLLVWVITCGLLLMPSGFWLGVVPAILLIVADKK